MVRRPGWNFGLQRAVEWTFSGRPVGYYPYVEPALGAGKGLLAALAAHEGWTADRLAAKATGKRTGWWGMSEAAEAFLDQLVTWRELGYNFCSHRADYDQYDSLWNAAMNQLKREGWFHNYLRMLWGKKILEWSATPRDALAAMIHLMNKWSLDGRNPNSYSGTFWTLGRYDRAWGPERPIFGTIRYMSSDNTARKLRVMEYIRRYETP